MELQALDKGNLGNAKTDGMDKDLGFVGNQYNTMLSIFYVPYVVFAPPIGMLGKKYGPHRVLPILMFCFGSATLLAASVKNWSGMMALRWFLGMFESSRRLVESVRLTVRRHVGVCLLSAGHLLLDYVLPKRRTCSSPGAVLCRVEHRECVLWSFGIRCIPHPIETGFLEIPVYY
jgi:MFS family permease